MALIRSAAQKAGRRRRTKAAAQLSCQYRASVDREAQQHPTEEPQQRHTLRNRKCAGP